MTSTVERAGALTRTNPVVTAAEWASRTLTLGPSALLRGRLRLDARIGEMVPGEYPVLVRVVRVGALGAGRHTLGLRITTPGGVQDLTARTCVNERWGSRLPRVGSGALSGCYSTPGTYTVGEGRAARLVLVPTKESSCTVEELGLEVVGQVVLELGTRSRRRTRRVGALTLEEYLGSGRHLRLDEGNDGGGLRRAPGRARRTGQWGTRAVLGVLHERTVRRRSARLAAAEPYPSD